MRINGKTILVTNPHAADREAHQAYRYGHSERELFEIAEMNRIAALPPDEQAHYDGMRDKNWERYMDRLWKEREK